MKVLQKLKGLIWETKETEVAVSPRAARLAGHNISVNPEKVLRNWVKSVLSTAPWAAVAVILFAVFVQGAAISALAYGLMKAAFAIVGTVVADQTMFNGMKEPRDHKWLPMIRRSMVFMGICWLMAVV